MSNGVISPVGARSILGVEVQPDFTTAVKTPHVLEYRSGDIDGQLEKLYSEANHDSPSPRGKVSVGNFSGSGEWVLELSPRRALPRLLTGLFGAPTETVYSPAKPDAPTLTKVGAHTAGATTRKYYIVARTASGIPSVPSDPTSLASTLATLDGSNSVTVDFAAPTAGVEPIATYDILMSVGSGTSVADAIKVGTVTAPTVTFSDIAGVGSAINNVSSAVSLKEWTHTWNRAFVTINQKKGDAIFCFPGVALHKMSLKVMRGDRGALVTSSFGAKPARKSTLADTGSSTDRIAAAMTETGLDAALYDDLPVWSDARGIVKIADLGGSLVAAAHMEGFGCDFDRNTADEYALNGKLGPSGFRDGISGLDATLDAKFISGSEADLKRFMGQASTISSESAYGFVGIVQQVQAVFDLLYPSGYGFDSLYEVVLPRAAYGALNAPVGGRGDAIKQSIRCEPIYDGTAGTDFIIRILSTESADSIANPSTTTMSLPSDDL